MCENNAKFLTPMLVIIFNLIFDYFMVYLVLEVFSNDYMLLQAPQKAVSKASTIVKRLQDLASGAVIQPNFAVLN